MEKTLSVIALVFAVSLAACQQNPSTPTPVETPAAVVTEIAPSAPVATPKVNAPAKPVKATKKTTTPRLDDAIRRIERLEKLARQYGAPI